MSENKDLTEETTAENTRGGSFLTPRVDIFETPAELVLLAEMPGARAEDVDLRFDRGELTLTARVHPRQQLGAPLTQEFPVGDFYRVFQIHESIDGSRIEASCKNGVLTIRLPKTEAIQPRQVTVKGE
jgi:HSP20 family molecular chaperone IbpA